MVMNNILD